MTEKSKIEQKIIQKISHITTDMSMLKNGLKTVGTAENSNLWLSNIRKETAYLQTLTNQYHECNN